MQRFKSPGSAQKFLSAYAAVCNAFNVPRLLVQKLVFASIPTQKIA
jgi:hypothetical protein